MAPEFLKLPIPVTADGGCHAPSVRLGGGWGVSGGGGFLRHGRSPPYAYGI